jgi:putative exporter of polyketide antibiotics
MFILVEFLFAASGTMLVIRILEYFCAQVPYSMKGLVAGCYYGCLGLCIMFNFGLSQVFKAKLHVWEPDTTFNCGFWYLLTKIIPVAIAAFMIALTIKFYKKRKREDILPNEHIFAEQYYSVQ